MYARKIAQLVQQIATEYQVVTITGPRQSGKTTLAKELFPSLSYVSLENIDARTAALTNPREFLARYSAGAIFDEIQHAPDLVSYMQQMVDEDQTPGRFVITGSQNFALSKTVSQSLAGRTGVVTLLPLSLTELGLQGGWLEGVMKGGYPKFNNLSLSRDTFFESYLHTYVERDVRQLQNVGDLIAFKNFMHLCAGRVGQVVNYTSLASDAGISPTAARQWLSILEASYMVFTIAPYYKNLNKRRIKMPKLYFYDVGMAAYLLGIENVEQLKNHDRRGQLFENLAMLEVLKSHHNVGKRALLMFWRDYLGMEVDLILESRGKLRAIEIKAAEHCYPRMIKGVQKFCEMQPEAKPYLIYTGKSDSYLGVTTVGLEDVEKFVE